MTTKYQGTEKNGATESRKHQRKRTTQLLNKHEDMRPLPLPPKRRPHNFPLSLVNIKKM